MEANDTPFLPSLDQNALPITEESLSHDLHRELEVAPPFAPPSGSISSVGDAVDGLNGPFNNIQGPLWNPFEPNPQTQGHISDHNGLSSNDGPTQNAPFREHDLFMPIANVVRIMRRGLPPHAKVADEAKEMVQECVSEFISFITSEANETCQLEHRKTVTAEDLIGAMSRLGFEHYVEPLSIYLQKYRESEMLPQMPRRNVGHICNEATNILPPFAVVHPQYAAMFGASFGNGGNYHDGSGTRSDLGHALDLDTANVCDANGPNLALGIDSGPNGSEEGSPSRPPQAGSGFYYPYDQYK